MFVNVVGMNVNLVKHFFEGRFSSRDTAITTRGTLHHVPPSSSVSKGVSCSSNVQRRLPKTNDVLA